MDTQSNRLEGILSVSGKGVGYLRTLEPKKKKDEEDVEIESLHLHTGLHGDTVLVALFPQKKGVRQTGEVVEIISRAKRGFSGVIEEENGVFFLKPDDTKMYTDILIPPANLGGAKAGEKAYVEIASWKDARKAPEGKVMRVLGKPGENSAEMNAIAIERGFAPDLPRGTEDEAQAISRLGISEKDYEGRRDFRNILTFTIDPADAKDFDDAISFRILPPLLTKERGSGGEVYEIGIHIADVSYYVRPGSELDQEARERATSVYLVDRTIPMLPEVLSNDLCSLVPGQDRLTMSAVFHMNTEGQVLDEWFGRTVIHSAKRFSYEDAEKSITDKNGELHAELAIINGIAKKLTAERFRKGAVSLDQEEVKFVLDEKGVPLKVIKKVRGDSNKLIEELMLLANRKVAERIGKGMKKGEGVFVYRIHDAPEKEKMHDLALFLNGLGYKVKLLNGVIPPFEINKLLASLAGKPEKDAVHRAVIRSMAKAIYSTKNIGHYGLAFEHYTHFTSPIRRYPDVMVHRLLMEYLAGKKVPKEKLSEYEMMSRKSSDQEKRASDAERASIKYKQTEYMSHRIGETFKGIISGVTEWGIYVEEIETKCEGMVRARDISDDFYIFDEKKLELVGKKKKKRYRLGDSVKIKVKKADLERKIIDYELA